MGLDKFYRKAAAKGSLDARGGLYSAGVPVFGSDRFVAGGSVFHVGSTLTGAASANSGKTPDRALLTIDEAINKCTASKGDLIVVHEGHAETITAAAGIALDIAGVSIVGMGQGALRPTVTFGTAVGASCDISAASTRISNILFLNDIDSQTAAVNITADDVTIEGCEFREGSAKQALIFVLVGAASNDADRTRVLNCKFRSLAVGANSAIKLGQVQDGVEVSGNDIDGDFADAGIHNPIGAILTDLLIAGNYVRNRQTGDHAIEIVSACTGACIDNRLFGDTEASILDPGSLFNARNFGTDAIDLAAYELPPTAADTAANMIGADNANNDAATTNVVANKDGSVLERLEDIKDELSGTAGIVTFPTGAAAANAVSLAEVLRYVQDQVINGTGTVLDTNTSLYGVLAGATGIPTFPTGAAAANSVSMAEVLRYIQDQVINGTGTALEANSSLFGVLAGATGVVTYPAAAAPANGVSLAEVLRKIYDIQVGNGTDASVNNRLGIRVDRTTADTITNTAVPLFTVGTGRILLTQLTGKVTTIIGAGVTNAKFQFNPTTGATNDMCANLDIDTDEAGALYSLTGIAADAMLRSESGAVRGMTSQGIILDVGDIEFFTNADRTGSISYQAWYIPLDNGATLVAA